jgi:MarR family transcriptional regulator, organic hydroperoxide resistance regulator
MIAYYNRELSPLGLTAQQLMALGVLWREEDLSLGVFARKAGIGKAAAVTMLRRLENMDLVTCGPHPQDGRLNVIRLTARARELAPEVTTKVQQLEKTIEQAIGLSNLHTMIEGLKVIRDLDL